MVGSVMLQVLLERKFPHSDLILVASEKSVGKKILYDKNFHTIVSLDSALKLKPNIALFSAGGKTSKEWAPKFAENGCIVIDNSSTWRMDAQKKLIIPEINANILNSQDKIIANPNCSTIQLLIAIAPIHSKYCIERLVISTYQSITGTGVKAVMQLENELNGKSGEMAYPHPIYKNAIPHCDIFQDNGYTKEEMKLVNETHKILDDNRIGITATAVRIPVVGGHSESVNITLKNDTSVNRIKKLLSGSDGVIVKDDIENNLYPMPITAEGNDNVFVGRIRKDFSRPNSFNLWIVSDNLRKGAATNTIQIAEYLIKEDLV
jgi:aspartate-semialdehyde dehydrogenase